MNQHLQKELVRTLDEATTKLDDVLHMLNMLHTDFNKQLAKINAEGLILPGKADALFAIRNDKDLLNKLQDDGEIETITPYVSETPIFVRYS